jgi:MscS family membrane protein
MKFLDTIIFDNSLKSYLIVLSIIVGSLLIRKTLSKLFATLLFSIFGKNWKKLNKQDFISQTIKPLSWFIVIVIVVFSIEKLKFPSSWDFELHNITLQTVLRKTGTVAMILAFFYCIAALIDFTALLLKQNNEDSNDKNHGQVVLFFRDLLRVFVAIIAVLLIIKFAFNQSIGSLLTGLSIVGAALALAAKESVENLIASFIIFFDKPFFIGDNVMVDAIYGKIEHIGLRSTRIRTLEKTLVTVPNKLMVDGVVDNLSMRNKWRSIIKFQLASKTTSATVKNIIADIKNIFTKVNLHQIIKHEVFFSEYSKEGIFITIEYFTEVVSKEDFDEIKQEVNFTLLSLTEKYELTISNAAESK